MKVHEQCFGFLFSQIDCLKDSNVAWYDRATSFFLLIISSIPVGAVGGGAYLLGRCRPLRAQSDPGNGSGGTFAKVNELCGNRDVSGLPPSERNMSSSNSFTIAPAPTAPTVVQVSREIPVKLAVIELQELIEQQEQALCSNPDVVDKERIIGKLQELLRNAFLESSSCRFFTSYDVLSPSTYNNPLPWRAYNLAKNLNSEREFLRPFDWRIKIGHWFIEQGPESIEASDGISSILRREIITSALLELLKRNFNYFFEALIKNVIKHNNSEYSAFIFVILFSDKTNSALKKLLELDGKCLEQFQKLKFTNEQRIFLAGKLTQSFLQRFPLSIFIE